MNKYYYHDGFREFGPFTPEELYAKRIRGDYKVRLEHDHHWLMAKKVEEIARLFKARSRSVESTAIDQELSPLHRDMQFENKVYSDTQKKQSDWRDGFILFIIAFWLFEKLVSLILQSTLDQWWEHPLFRISEGFFVLMAIAIPIVLGISIKGKYQVAGIILGGLLAVLILSRQLFYWFN
ncbi:hypothetical protein [Nonlabens xiamenensis]|uniref:hypothetical protein n=1 Tax=Nonlabens xiamenensis TaxID=2341043 RepID=UPI000F61191E|nr:hypothetical protein [Nonlabens xiamenensis]